MGGKIFKFTLNLVFFWIDRPKAFKMLECGGVLAWLLPRSPGVEWGGGVHSYLPFILLGGQMDSIVIKLIISTGEP